MSSSSSSAPTTSCRRSVAEWVLEAESLPHDRLSELEWVVGERPVMGDEIGSSPLACGYQVLAVVRDGRRIWVEDPAVGELRGDDRLVVLSSTPVGD